MDQHHYGNCLHNIAWLRAHHGLNRVQMARLLHISVATLRRIERGDETVVLRGSVAFYIEKEFGVKPADLFRKWL